MNQTEYEWVKQTRNLIFDCCRELDPNDFLRQVDGFGIQSMGVNRTYISE